MSETPAETLMDATKRRVKTHDNGVQVFGKFCGLGCHGLNKTGMVFCDIFKPYENSVTQLIPDKTANQILRCEACAKENG